MPTVTVTLVTNQNRVVSAQIDRAALGQEARANQLDGDLHRISNHDVLALRSLIEGLNHDQNPENNIDPSRLTRVILDLDGDPHHVNSVCLQEELDLFSGPLWTTLTGQPAWPLPSRLEVFWDGINGQRAVCNEDGVELASGSAPGNYRQTILSAIVVAVGLTLFGVGFFDESSTQQRRERVELQKAQLGRFISQLNSDEGCVVMIVHNNREMGRARKIEQVLGSLMRANGLAFDGERIQISDQRQGEPDPERVEGTLYETPVL